MMTEKIAAGLLCILVLSVSDARAQQAASPAAPTAPDAAAAPAGRDSQAAAARSQVAPTNATNRQGAVAPGSELSTVRSCRVHTQRTMEYIEQLNTSIQQARMAQDRARVNAVLDQMQSYLNQMKQHASICMERLAQSR